MYKAITEARRSGYSDDDILSYMVSTNHDIEKSTTQALRSGYKAKDILDFIATTTKESKLPKELPTTKPIEQSAKGGIVGGFKRGFASGTTGLIGGAEEQLPRNEGILEHIGALAGETVSDLPAMGLGGLAGGVAGSAVPVVGTATGSAIGAFATPAIIKQAFAEYRQHSKQGTDLTFGEFLERASSVGWAGTKAGISGAVVSKAAKLIPIMKKTPGLNKLLATKLGPTIEQPIAEVAALAGAHTATEGKVPSLGELGDMVAVIAGFRVTNAMLNKTHNIMETNGSSVREAMKEAGIKFREGALTKEEAKSKYREDVKKQHPDVGGDAEEFKKTRAKYEERKKEPDRPIRRKTIEKVDAVKDRVKGTKDALDDRIETFKREQTFFDTLKEPIEKSRSSKVESQFKWRNEFKKSLQEHGKDFTKGELEEALYYRQKTGNPKKSGDTFEKLSERMPESLKKMDKVFEKHLSNQLKVWNENISTKDIAFRENYLTGIYEEPPGGFKKAMEKVEPKFKDKNPFSNPKVFNDYAEAYEKAGLVPKYKNVIDIMRYYDDVTSKVKMNNEIVKTIEDIGKTRGEKMIVTPDDGEAYKKAKDDGWVAYYDPFLRKFREVKDGKTTYGTHAEPAYVHPDLDPAVRGIFNKDVFKSDPKILKAYDSVNSLLKMARVSFSLFHYVPLSESAIGAMGLKFFKGLPGAKKFFPDNWRDNAELLRANEEFMKDAAKYIEIDAMPDAEQMKKGEDMMSQFFDKMPEDLRFGDKKTVDLTKSYDWVMKFNRYLFNTYQPLLKIATFDYYVKDAVSRHIAEGHEITPELMVKIKRECGELTNNQLGGQIKQLSRVFNDPVSRKWMQRIIGYPDWTVSALKQAAGAFGGGVKGDMARSYWTRYIMSMAMIKSMMSLLMGGFSSKEDEDNKLSWSANKAVKSLSDNDPTQWYSFPLPDMNIKIAGVKFNPGRDEKRRKKYSHFGKQALEIPRYVKSPGDAMFGKSSPVIQAFLKQLMGASPYKGEAFPIRGKYVGGSNRPWDATMPGTAKRAVSRTKSLAGEFIPFSARGVSNQGISTWIASGLGSLPVSKGMSLRKAEPYIYDALKTSNISKLNKITKVLQDNGYDISQIKRTITSIKKYQLERDKSNKK